MSDAITRLREAERESLALIPLAQVEGEIGATVRECLVQRDNLRDPPLVAAVLREMDTLGLLTDDGQACTHGDGTDIAAILRRVKEATP